MVLLVGAGLMINTLLRLQKVNPGFDPKNVMTMEIQLPEGGKYMERVPGGDMEKTLPTVTAFYQQLLERISATPGLESAGLVSSLPAISSATPMKRSGSSKASAANLPMSSVAMV